MIPERGPMYKAVAVRVTHIRWRAGKHTFYIKINLIIGSYPLDLGSSNCWSLKLTFDTHLSARNYSFCPLRALENDLFMVGMKRRNDYGLLSVCVMPPPFKIDLKK